MKKNQFYDECKSGYRFIIVHCETTDRHDAYLYESRTETKARRRRRRRRCLVTLAVVQPRIDNREVDSAPTLAGQSAVSFLAA